MKNRNFNPKDLFSIQSLDLIETKHEVEKFGSSIFYPLSLEGMKFSNDSDLIFRKINIIFRYFEGQKRATTLNNVKTGIVSIGGVVYHVNTLKQRIITLIKIYDVSISEINKQLRAHNFSREPFIVVYENPVNAIAK